MTTKCVVLFISLALLTLLFIIRANGQPINAADQSLVIIKNIDYQKMDAETKLQFRIYQRLDQYLFTGIDITGMQTIASQNIPVQIVDASPVSEEYAVVSSRGEPAKNLSQNIYDGAVLFTTGDMYLVKGSAESFEQLRRDGFTCAPVARTPILLRETETMVPRTVQSFAQNDVIANIVSQVSDSAIASTIAGLQAFGTRHCLSSNRDSVSQWIFDRFAANGISDVALDLFGYSGTTQKNVIATIPGSLYPEREIIIGGHLDSYSSIPDAAPGADDNASGLSAAIEMARVLKLANYSPAVTLRFIGFAAEEAGLLGAYDYAAKASGDSSRHVVVMQNYDMIGNRNQAQPDRDFNIVTYLGSEEFSNLHAAMAQTYTTLTPVFTTSYRSASDSWSFYQQGMHVTYCSERDFSPYYHTANDLLQYMDVPYAREIIQAGLAMLLTLDQPPPPVQGLQAQFVVIDSTVLAQWDNSTVPDFSHYRISLHAVDSSFDTVFTRSAPSCVIPHLTANKEYRLRVEAVDLAGIMSEPAEEIINPDLRMVVSILLNDRWNLVSVPLHVDDYCAAALFPSAVSTAQYFNGAYFQCDTLDHHRGYWLKFDGTQLASMVGLPVEDDSIGVVAGWNLIGSMSIPVPVGDITSSVPDMITSQFWKYSRGYSATDTIYSGRGYWVKVNQDGVLYFSSTKGRSKTYPITIAETNEEPPPAPSDISKAPLPKEFYLGQNYPNPFNPATVISYQLPVSSFVTLKIYNVLGQEVNTLVNGIRDAGYESVEWDAGSMTSGMYFYRIEAVGVEDPSRIYSNVRKMVLLK